MGMFDYVKFECECPICKSKIKDFQTKDDSCIMKELEFWEVKRFYSYCSKCGTWIEFYNFNRENKKIVIEDYNVVIKINLDNLALAKSFFENPKKVYEKLEKEKWDKVKNEVEE